jgi:serine/threonine-protein kinase
VLPTAGAEPAVTKKRNPWTWPLIALIALLVVVLVGTIIALLVQPSGKPTVTPPTTTSSTPPPSATPSSTPTPDTVKLSLGSIKGKTQDQVQSYLDSLGLTLKPVTGDPATTSSQVGKAYDAEPIGDDIAKGTEITVSFYDAVATPPAPDAPTTTTAGPYTAGQQVPVSWGSYSGCPGGQSVSGWQVTVINGSNPEGNSTLNPPQTSVTVTLGTSGSTTVTYVALCGSQKTQSDSSSPLSFTIGD